MMSGGRLRSCRACCEWHSLWPERRRRHPGLPQFFFGFSERGGDHLVERPRRGEPGRLLMAATTKGFSDDMRPGTVAGADAHPHTLPCDFEQEGDLHATD